MRDVAVCVVEDLQADYLRGERSEDKPFGSACDRVPESDSPSWRHGGGQSTEQQRYPGGVFLSLSGAG